MNRHKLRYREQIDGHQMGSGWGISNHYFVHLKNLILCGMSTVIEKKF